MQFAELGPDFVDHDEYHAIVDPNYDWHQQNQLFTPEQINLMQNRWLESQKTIQDHLEETECPKIFRHQLNRMQKFAYDIIQKHKTEKKQILMIVNGGAGSGKIVQLIK